MNPTQASPTVDPKTVQFQGFGVADVWSVRPDLTAEDAVEVIERAEARFDASVGLDFDLLEDHAAHLFSYPYVIGGMLASDAGEFFVTVDLSKGTILNGSIEQVLLRYIWSQREALDDSKLKNGVISFPHSDERYDVEHFQFLGGDSERLQEFTAGLRKLEAEKGIKLIHRHD